MSTLKDSRARGARGGGGGGSLLASAISPHRSSGQPLGSYPYTHYSAERRRAAPSANPVLGI